MHSEDKTMENIFTENSKLAVSLIFALSEYLLVLLSVIADLISGLRKAKRRGEARRSKALRRTVDKVCRYYNALFALSVIDAMQIIAVLYLQAVNGFEIPVAPVFTFLGSICIALIEVKSIHEKAEEKEQDDAEKVARLLLKHLQHFSKNITL